MQKVSKNTIQSSELCYRTAELKTVAFAKCMNRVHRAMDKYSGVNASQPNLTHQYGLE